MSVRELIRLKKSEAKETLEVAERVSGRCRLLQEWDSIYVKIF
jgi:hypothetical protein